MLDIIISPTRRFKRISERTDWLLPFLIALLLPLLISTLSMIILPRSLLINAIEERLAKTKEFVDQQIEKGRIPSDQRNLVLQRIEEVSHSEIEFLERASTPRIFLRFFLRSIPAVLWSGLHIFLWSTILNLLLPLLGIQSSFLRVFSITSNSALVRIPSALFHTLLMLTTNKLAPKTNLSLLFPHLSSHYLKGLLSCIDIFTIWELILVALGLKVVFNLKIKHTIAIVSLIWLFYILLLSGLVALSGGIALQ